MMKFKISTPLFFMFSFLFLASFTSNVDTIEVSLNKTQANFKVMSYNIRYANTQDAENGNAWETRSQWIIKQIQYHKPLVIGMQEVLKSQLDLLTQNLQDYAWAGVGRDDGKDAGEYSPILYHKKYFQLLETQTFWLSESPEKPSKSWDAAYPRIVTYIKLKHKSSKKVFYFFNTHFDHKGETARNKSAQLIVKKIKSIAHNYPVLVSGDFNATPKTSTYANMLEGTILQDAFHKSKAEHYGVVGTFSGFEVCSEITLDRRIDYIFVNKKVEVLDHAILSEAFHQKYPSDHLPVLAEIVLK